MKVKRHREVGGGGINRTTTDSKRDGRKQDKRMAKERKTIQGEKKRGVEEISEKGRKLKN